MRNLIIAYFCTLIFNNSYAQYVPERFSIKTTDLGSNFNSVKKDYHFYVSAYNRKDCEDRLNKEVYPFPYDDHNSVETIYTYIYILGSKIKNETLILKIKNKKNVMTIYIRHYNYLSEGQIIQLDNFKFKKGHYFFDMYETKSEYQTDFKQDEKKIILDIINLKKHMICLKKLPKLLKN
jgi:hypothetical protein